MSLIPSLGNVTVVRGHHGIELSGVGSALTMPPKEARRLARALNRHADKYEKRCGHR